MFANVVNKSVELIRPSNAIDTNWLLLRHHSNCWRKSMNSNIIIGTWMLFIKRYRPTSGFIYYIMLIISCKWL